MQSLNDVTMPLTIPTPSWWFWIKGGIGFTIGIGIASFVLWPIYIIVSIVSIGRLLGVR